MRHAEIVHRCFRCGWCKLTTDYADINCPSYRKFRFDTFAPGGRMWLINAWLNGHIENSPRFQEVLFSCATCGNCSEHCVFSFAENLVDIFIAAREEMVNRGIIPVPVRDYFKNINLYGNPYGRPAKERGLWADGSGLESYDGQEYLFYAGCVGSFDERGCRIARKACSLMARAGISLGILGEREICDGNEVRALGETGLFESLARKNISLFRQLQIEKIIALDPHAFHAFSREYPALGGNFEVYHYTQILDHLVTTGRIPLKGLQARVAYHDPCYLGRHGGEYEAPRRILESVPGLELVEMRQNRENALCCGGGGGNFFTDILGGGEDSPNRIRARQALDTGADIIAVACVQCARMLEDGLKSEGQGKSIQVMDLGEILLAAML
jgi:Fe-S oxidoreductase